MELHSISTGGICVVVTSLGGLRRGAGAEKGGADGAGEQVVQLFDSWAHHLSPAQYEEFSLPYANRIMRAVHAARPDVPLIFHANGGASSSASSFINASFFPCNLRRLSRTPSLPCPVRERLAHRPP